MNERERVREAIAKEICEGLYPSVSWETLLNKQEYLRVASQILTEVPGLRIEADDQYTPINPYDVGPYNYYIRGKSIAYQDAQQEMIDAGFVKCILNEVQP
ncbi:MAG: hypothetical protein KKD44_26215 [Proteobacteria bacterium]|nr:hypothetical protein [Pseudomonadota bacterium]